jgi:hypothetical protein
MPDDPQSAEVKAAEFDRMWRDSPREQATHPALDAYEKRRDAKHG